MPPFACVGGCAFPAVQVDLATMAGRAAFVGQAEYLTLLGLAILGCISLIVLAVTSLRWVVRRVR